MNETRKINKLIYREKETLYSIIYWTILFRILFGCNCTCNKILPNVSSMMRFRLFKTGEMEVKNPMFHDDPTPATPSQNHKEEEHM